VITFEITIICIGTGVACGVGAGVGSGVGAGGSRVGDGVGNGVGPVGIKNSTNTLKYKVLKH